MRSDAVIRARFRFTDSHYKTSNMGEVTRQKLQRLQWQNQ